METQYQVLFHVFVSTACFVLGLKTTFHDTYHMLVASSPAESNLPVNMAMFSPASFLSLFDECCRVRARASFSAQACASLARSSAHFSGGTPCMERHLLCAFRACLGNASFGEEVLELDGMNRSAENVIIYQNVVVMVVWMPQYNTIS